MSTKDQELDAIYLRLKDKIPTKLVSISLLNGARVQFSRLELQVNNEEYRLKNLIKARVGNAYRNSVNG